MRFLLDIVLLSKFTSLPPLPFAAIAGYYTPHGLMTFPLPLAPLPLLLLNVPQYLQHALRRLFLGIKPVHQFSVLVPLNDHVFG